MNIAWKYAIGLVFSSLEVLAQLPVCAPRIEGSCDLTLGSSNGQLSSFAQAQFYSATCGPGSTYMDGEHKIANANGATVEILQWGVQGGSYSGTRTATATLNVCYSASNYATAYPGGYPPGPNNPPIRGGPWTSAQRCFTTPLPPPPEPAACTEFSTNPECSGRDSPIVINFANGPYQLTGSESPVLFDMGATGTPVRIGWTAGGADEAFLWRDLNGNVKVDNGAELFGNATKLKNGQTAENGFVALAEYDDNDDGVIDNRDAIWSELKLWTDLNHDAVSQSWEIEGAEGSRFTAIAVRYLTLARLRDSYGNLFRYASLAWTRRGGARPTPRPVFDIFFVRVP